MRLTLFSALLASGITHAALPIDGLYSSVFGGFTYVVKNLNKITTEPVNGSLFRIYRDGTGYRSGYHGGVRLGYQGYPLRYELEYTYLRANLKHFEINLRRQRGVHGFTAANTAMANIYYDFPEMLPTISPFLGVGIGYANVQTSLSALGFFAPPLIFPTHLSIQANSLAYQGTVGFTYNFCEDYALNIAYRYISTRILDGFGERLQAHLGSVGAIYRFDSALYQ